VQGLLLIQEAYHFRAQQASGQMPSTDDIAEICTMATDPTVVNDCTMAIEDTNPDLLTYPPVQAWVASGPAAVGDTLAGPGGAV
jgi:hypothetical protein